MHWKLGIFSFVHNVFFQSFFYIWFIMMDVVIFQIIEWIVVTGSIVDHFWVEVVQDVFTEIVFKVHVWDIVFKLRHFYFWERFELIFFCFSIKWRSCVDLNFLLMYHFTGNSFKVCKVFRKVKTTWFFFTFEFSLIYWCLKHIFKYNFLSWRFIGPFSRFLTLIGDHVAIVVCIQYLEVFNVLMFKFLLAKLVFVFWFFKIIKFLDVHWFHYSDWFVIFITKYCFSTWIDEVFLICIWISFFSEVFS